MLVSSSPPPRKNRGKRRQNPYPRQREQPWAIYFKAQMILGNEFCRKCFKYKPHASQCKNSNTGLQWGHIKSDRLGGRFTVHNITIVCGPCNREMKWFDWTGYITSLEAEWERIKMTVDLDAARQVIANASARANKQENPQMSFNSVLEELKMEIHHLAELVGIVLNELEEARTRKPISRRDKLTPHAQKVLDFLKQYPGMAMQVGSIVSNLEDITMEEGSSAVASLFHRDLIKRRVPPKRANAKTGAYAYYYEAPKVEDNG